eukprot:SAG22_NODE_15757_length_341_cov_1.066116_1_plen_38_part_01
MRAVHPDKLPTGEAAGTGSGVRQRLKAQLVFEAIRAGW